MDLVVLFFVGSMGVAYTCVVAAVAVAAVVHTFLGTKRDFVVATIVVDVVFVTVVAAAVEGLYCYCPNYCLWARCFPSTC